MQSKKKLPQNNKELSKSIRLHKQCKKRRTQTKKRARKLLQKVAIQSGGNVLTTLYESFVKWLKDIGLIEKDEKERIIHSRKLRLDKERKNNMIYKSINAEERKKREREFQLASNKYDIYLNKRNMWWCRFINCDKDVYKINSDTSSSNSNTGSENDIAYDSNSNSNSNDNSAPKSWTKVPKSAK